ncbi:unnamed protein product [Caenorhabditis sp. 36 PRJEB53466]|nr:unnamed protein product [Caenorhabditis sp. 36 PRJEB53466]
MSLEAYVTLEIPQGTPDPDEWDQIVREQENLLSLSFQQYNFIISPDGERTRVGGELEDPFYESTLKVEAIYVMNKDILAAAQLFIDRTKRFHRFDRCSLVLICPELFDKELICSLGEMKTDKIMFGNVINKTFYSHWEVSFDNRRPLNNLSRAREDPRLHKIKTTFDFDKTMPITVDYWTVESFNEKRSPKGGRSKKIVHHKLFVEGDSLQRIIVDHQKDNGKGGISTRVYLVLRTPPILKRGILNSPSETKPVYHRILQLRWGKSAEMTSSKNVLTENPILCIEFDGVIVYSKLYSLLSRLRFRWNVPIELAKIDNYSIRDTHGGIIPGDCILLERDNMSPYHRWTNGRNPVDVEECNFRDFLERTFPKPKMSMEEVQGKVRNKAADENNERMFTYVYLITALLSRGAVVKDQLLLHRDAWNHFLSIIEKHSRDDQKRWLCEAALEDLLNHVDLQPRVGSIISVFERFCNERRKTGIHSQMTNEQWDQGFRKVRKIVLTPTRRCPVIPEIIMSNRALSKDSVLGHLSAGFTIARTDFGYLGSSNSQMRDGGGYFMERYSRKMIDAYRYENGKHPPVHYKPKILMTRKQLGKFEKTGSIPKAMARLGQCFTQAIECPGLTIGSGDYRLVPDVVGGKQPKAAGSRTPRKPFIFTDGIGMISVKLARIISNGLKLPTRFAPSAFQYRFRGMKGMLVVDPSLDDSAAYFKDLYRKGKLIPDVYKTNDEFRDLAPWTYKILFRESQLKFLSNDGKSKEWPIEIVKWSTPTPLTLNRPFISILDHVSSKQSLECHKRICGRVEELLDLQLASFTKSIINEESCRSKLEEMPRRVNFRYLQDELMSMSTEPFFRSLIKASVDAGMVKLLQKIQIQVPPDLGRTMFGVTDETGQLQYGQVFFQYTNNVNMKTPSKTTAKTIYKGQVLITKFPAVVAGDVRLFEAVDIPELHHLENVVVFPQNGPRPHPDEMAGSDLDGDEYAVVWDPLLFFEHNEEAFKYCSAKPEQAFNEEDMDAKMHEFFTDYMEQDGVGHIFINHLYQADQFGLESEVCDRLAQKSSMALDYAKSGVAPEPLTTMWTHNRDTGEYDPPEKSERVPDFALGHNRFTFQPMYISSRLLGSLSRELRSINDVIVASVQKPLEVIADVLMDTPLWRRYEILAAEQMKQYNARLRSIMDQYGIRTEAEIFSGCFREIRNRITDRDQDDMSMFNTEHIIEQQMTDLFRKFREEFFEEFKVNPDSKGYLKWTEPENERYENTQTDVLRRVCKRPTAEMMQKAVAYYNVCYDSAANGTDRKLSFGWIAYDILKVVRRENYMKSDTIEERRHPHFQAILEHRHIFIKDNEQQMKQFLRQLRKLTEDERENEAKDIIVRYLRVYPGLEKSLFVILSWANETSLLKNSGADPPLKWYHVVGIAILLAARHFGSLAETDPRNYDQAIIQILDPKTSENDKVCPLADTEVDRLTVTFFRFLSTRHFRRLPSLNFLPIGLSSVFLRGEWIPYHKTSIKTYYNLLLNMRFEELPTSKESITTRKSVQREGQPFIVELPKGTDIEYILAQVKSKCADVVARVDSSTKHVDRLLVSSRGTVEQLQTLREFMAVKLPRFLWQMDINTSKQLAALCYFQITEHEFDAPLKLPRRLYEMKCLCCVLTLVLLLAIIIPLLLFIGLYQPRASLKNPRQSYTSTVPSVTTSYIESLIETKNETISHGTQKPLEDEEEEHPEGAFHGNETEPMNVEKTEQSQMFEVEEEEEIVVKKKTSKDKH